MRASPGCSPRIRPGAAELQDVCSRALHGFKLLSVLLAPVLPAARAARGAASSSASTRRSPGATREVLPTRINPYQHLMTRVDPKQLDALFERPPAAPAAAAGAAGRSQPSRAPATISIDDFAQSTCASRASSTPRRSKARQAAEADARPRRPATRTVFAGIKSAYDPATARRPAHRGGRQPGAAQDEVRRLRGHGAGRQRRRRRGCTCCRRTPAPRRA